MGNCCFKKARQPDMESDTSQMGKYSPTVEKSPKNNDEAVTVPEENLAPGAKLPMPKENQVPLDAEVPISIVLLQGLIH